NMGGLDGLGDLLIMSLNWAGIPLTMGGVLFLGASTSLGEKAPTLLFFLGFLIAYIINYLAEWMSNNWVWAIATFPVIAFPLMGFGAAVVVFVGSYFITARLYEKMDF
ncbi:MAG: hypothetical protein FWG63_01985, partial [Defluviitaleaceae bacterium]|nr:hypothetical protein [Defluviitaleaceae bacterium]